MTQGLAPGESGRDVARVLALVADREQIYVGEGYLQGGKTLSIREELNPPAAC